MLKSPNEVAFAIIAREFAQSFKSCEGRSKRYKYGWVPFQNHLFVVFFPYSFASTLFLFHFFLLCEKSTPNSKSILKNRYGLLVSSTSLCAILTSFFSFHKQILFSIFSIASSDYKL